jgi:two-component system NarL family sensor kinase
MADKDITSLILITTLIFLIAPAFLLLYVFIYNSRKKKHIEEKAQMKLAFDNEIIKTQLEVQEQTMQTIGADLHDNIGQLLSLTSLTLNSVKLDDDVKARQKISSAIDLTSKSIKELRQLGKLLQGDQLIVMGLSEAVKQEINWIEKAGNYQVTYIQENELPAACNSQKDLILFRILQEIFNNIIKHSKATQIIIKLGYRDLLVELQVTDNGAGFNEDEVTLGNKGSGLFNIQKRAQIVGGEVIISSKTGGGTFIDVYIPYP